MTDAAENSGRAQVRGKNARVKAWLWGYQKARREHERLAEDYSEFRQAREEARAVAYDGMPSAAGGSDLSSVVAQIEAFEARLVRAECAEQAAWAERQEAISEIPSLAQREVLSLRYMRTDDFKRPYTWDEIAGKLGYSRRAVILLHGQALNWIAARMGKDCL